MLLLPAKAVPHLVRVRCHWCSQQRPEYRVHRLQSNQVICDHCLEWHGNALDVLAGAIPAGCQVCGATWQHLRDTAPSVEVRMYVVPKDGIYQLLCAGCVRPYVRKRSDLYRDTQFGKDDLKL